VLETTGQLSSRKPAVGPCVLAHYYRYLRILDPAQSRLVTRYAKQAIAVNDHPDDAWLSIGIMQDKANRPQKALAAIQQALAINPRNAEANRWAAVLYSERGDLLNEYRMIRAAFEAALEDEFYITHLDHVLIEKLGDAHQAAALFEAALLLNPDNFKALDRLAYCYGLVGAYEQAAHTYAHTVRLQPERVSSYLGLGFALGRSGRKPEALKAYQRAMQIAPLDPEPHARLGNFYHGENKYPEAIEAYEASFALGNDDLVDLGALCALYHVVSEFEKAAGCFEQVLRRDPRNTLAQRLLPEVRRNLPSPRGAR
jgi:tetratricopeptide (TPR) repeat protein